MDAEHLKDLLRRAKADELDAFERIFEFAHLRVLALVRQRLSPNLRAVLESGDAAQEVMVDAILSYRRWDVEATADILALLATMVENCLHSLARYHRAQKRNRAKERALRHINESMASGALSLEPVDPATPAVDRLGRQEEQRLAIECLDELAPPDRELIKARLKYPEATWDDLAKRLGFSSGEAARKREQRARDELKRIYRRRKGRSAPGAGACE